MNSNQSICLEKCAEKGCENRCYKQLAHGGRHICHYHRATMEVLMAADKRKRNGNGRRMKVGRLSKREVGVLSDKPIRVLRLDKDNVLLSTQAIKSVQLIYKDDRSKCEYEFLF